MTLPAYNPEMGQTIGLELVDRGFIAHLAWSAVQNCAADTDGIIKGIECSTKATVVESGFTALLCARNITATVAATTAAEILAVKVKITGLNIHNEIITEELPVFTTGTTGSVTGSKAFASVTKVEIPAMGGDTVTVDIGFGVKLGVPFKLPHDTTIKAYNSGSTAESGGTWAVSATAYEDNTYQASATGKSLDLYIIV
ncbi:MAG: hypothetical protein M0P69_19840 [Bacteroidales bacterium]|nr:hypothetical protein [Bacteroidales bacterium]